VLSPDRAEHPHNNRNHGTHDVTTRNAKTDPQVQAFFRPEMLQIYRSAAPVSEWAINAWCCAMGDQNPVYQDREAARRHGHKDVFAPPVMMHSFTLPGVVGESEDSLLTALRRRLAPFDIDSVLAANYEHEYITPIRVGDRLTREVRFESMSDEKVTAVGIGHFVVMVERILNQDGEIIGNQKTRVLFFRPGKFEKPQSSAAPHAAETPKLEALNRVDLPPLVIPLTTTLVVSGALASNDFEKIHHDRDVAQAQGLKDVVMNVLTSCGLILRYVTDWAGPATVVKRIASQLKIPNYPGDVMTLTGWAEKPFERGTETVLRVRGTNSLGTHIESTITIT
jgi:acyl dehydratase